MKYLFTMLLLYAQINCLNVLFMFLLVLSRFIVSK